MPRIKQEISCLAATTRIPTETRLGIGSPGASSKADMRPSPSSKATGASSKADMRPSPSSKATSWKKARGAMQATFAFSNRDRDGVRRENIHRVLLAPQTSSSVAPSRSGAVPAGTLNGSTVNSSRSGAQKNNFALPQQRSVVAPLSGEAVVERAMAVQDELRAWREQQDK